MAKLDVWDGRNALILTDGAVGNTERFRVKIGRLARPPPVFDPTETHGGMLAWALTTKAQNLARSKGYDAQRLGYETWVIGPTSDESLRDWFVGHTPDSPYRVLIHREIREYGDPSRWKDMWYHAHRSLEIRSKRRRFQHCKPNAQNLLNEIMDAYAHSHETVTDVLRARGIPYWHSYGLFSPKSNSLSSGDPSRIQQNDQPEVSGT